MSRSKNQRAAPWQTDKSLLMWNPSMGKQLTGAFHGIKWRADLVVEVGSPLLAVPQPARQRAAHLLHDPTVRFLFSRRVTARSSSKRDFGNGTNSLLGKVDASVVVAVPGHAHHQLLRANGQVQILLVALAETETCKYGGLTRRAPRLCRGDKPSRV